MITKWISSETLVSRLYRNVKGIEAVYNDSIMEWIPEAVLKLQTKYSFEVRPYKIAIQGNQGKLPCKIEGVLCVTYGGSKLSYRNGNETYDHNPNYEGLLFQSINPIYTSSGDISVGDAGRSKFPTDVIVPWDMQCDRDHWYTVNGNYIQTSIDCGTVCAWVQDIPRDANGYPLIPGTEFAQEAIYRYCRMMLIEAGYEDKVFSHPRAEEAWNKAAAIAINDIFYPTPDQVESSIHRHLDDFFPDSTYNYSY